MLGGIASAKRVRVQLVCCAHAATIIWYLRKGKHSQYRPKSETCSTTVKDATVVPQTVPQTDSELELDD